MKKIFVLLLCSYLLCGCGNALGSFEKGTLDMKLLIQKVNHETSEGSWDMSLLKEAGEDMSSLESYGITKEDVVSYGIFTSIIEVNPEAIAIFEMSDNNKEMVKEKIRSHLMEMERNSMYLDQYKECISAYKEAEIGNYYIIVIGKDASHILQFMEECA